MEKPMENPIDKYIEILPKVGSFLMIHSVVFICDDAPQVARWLRADVIGGLVVAAGHGPELISMADVCTRDVVQSYARIMAA